MIHTVRHAGTLALAFALLGCTIDVEEPAVPPPGATVVAQLPEDELLEQLDREELYEEEPEAPGDPAGLYSIYSCSLTPYAPFWHAGNLHAKGDLRCAGYLGQAYEVHTNLQVWFQGQVFDLTQAWGWCVTSGYGCTADGWAANLGSNYYRTRIRVVRQGGGTVRTAYTSFLWR